MWFFGQSHEDKIAAVLLTADTGNYVDIGAHDGVNFSNTYYFYQRGWRGVCVEPHRKTYQELVDNRPGDLNVQAAVSNHSGFATFHALPDGALSGLSRNEARAEAEYRAYGLVTNWETYQVAVYTFDHLLEYVGYDGRTIDLISIDVEDYEPQVIAGIDFNRWQPRLLMIEENNPDAVRAAMRDVGYHYAGSVEQNGFFTRTAEDAAIIAHAIQTRDL